MGAPLLLQFSIALLTGMVAATFVPPVRKAIPRTVEVGLWTALVTVCALGVVSVTDKNARDLSVSALWGADQVIRTIAGLMLAGAAGWIADNRMAVVSWLILVAGADVLALMLLSWIRRATPWQPRVRLRDWVELPAPAPKRAPAPVAEAHPRVERRSVGASAAVAGAMLVRTVDFSTRARDAFRADSLGRVARLGTARSSASVESLRHSVAHLQFALRSWYVAAGEPAVGDISRRALRRGKVIDIRGLIRRAAVDTTRGEDGGHDSQRPDTMAS